MFFLMLRFFFWELWFDHSEAEEYSVMLYDSIARLIFFKICYQKYTFDTFFPFYAYAKLKSIVTSDTTKSLAC